MKTFLASFLIISSLGLAACDVDEGPVEEAGESIDNAMTDAGNKIEDTCENVKEEMGSDNENC